MSDKLDALLASGDSPVIGPITTQALRDFVAAQPVLDMPSPDRIENMVSKLSLATAKRKITREEAGETLELYVRALNDIPLVDLARAFDDLLKTATFMPKPAEVRAAARRYAAQREFKVSRARYLIALHERDYVPPVPSDQLVTAGELDALKVEVAGLLTDGNAVAAPSAVDDRKQVTPADAAAAAEQAHTTFCGGIWEELQGGHRRCDGCGAFQRWEASGWVTLPESAYEAPVGRELDDAPESCRSVSASHPGARRG